MAGARKRDRRSAVAADRQPHNGDFTFHGFGAAEHEEWRKIARLRIRTDPPGIAIVDDALFIPDRAAEDSQPRFTGGLLGPDGEPVEIAQLHRKGGKPIGGPGERPLVSAASECDMEVVYLGHLFNHYGHILLESLARAWYLEWVDPSLKVVFNTGKLTRASLTPWMARLLDLFGIPAERMLVLEQPTRLRRAIVPEPLFEQMHMAHKDMVRPFRAVAARIAGDPTPSPQPLYLSRRRLSSKQRPVIGETELEEVLRANGFRIAYPETMTIEEQIRLINSHADIFSSAGSAAHTILFALRGPRLHLLVVPDHVPTNYYLCSMLASTPTTLVNCLTAGREDEPDVDAAARDTPDRPRRRRNRDPVPIRQATPQLLDLSRVLDYLDERGFLTHRPSAPDSAAQARREARFGEAAIYARVRRLTGKSGSLPPDLETKALHLAATSWPISLVLARFYAHTGDDARTEVLAQQFAAQAGLETDDERLAYYRGDAVSTIAHITRHSTPDTAAILSQLQENRFGGDMPLDDELPA